MIYRIYNKIRSLLLSDYRKSKYYKSLKKIENQIDNNKKSIFLLQTPVHINIGDHFISVAEIQFFETHFKDCNIVEIQEDKVVDFLRSSSKKVRAKDRIVIHGGGNLGNEYIHHENLRRQIIKTFPNNKVIILPQTIHFSNDEHGKIELEKSIIAYSNHNNLVICAREEKSYEFAKINFRNKVLLVPDTVLQYRAGIGNTNSSLKKETAITVLRSDRESILNEEDRKFITDTVSTKYKNIVRTDMFHENKNIVINNAVLRQTLIDDRLTLFRNSNLVVTDRLHGMIVSAITGVPCIAIGNYNHKIIESFKWIELSTNTLFIHDISKLPKAVLDLEDLVKKKGESRTPQLDLSKNYNQLIEEIR